MKLSIRLVDIAFAVIGSAGVYTIFKEPKSAEIIVNSWNPWFETGLAIALTSLIALYAVWAAKFDRQCAEDYVFQLVTNAALIAVITAMLSHAIWDFSMLNARGLPKPTSGEIMGVLMLSWAMGYIFYRARGVNA